MGCCGKDERGITVRRARFPDDRGGCVFGLLVMGILAPASDVAGAGELPDSEFRCSIPGKHKCLIADVMISLSVPIGSKEVVRGQVDQIESNLVMLRSPKRGPLFAGDSANLCLSIETIVSVTD